MTHVVIAVAVLYVVAVVIVLRLVKHPEAQEPVDDWPDGVTADDVRSLYGAWVIRHADRLREEIR